MPAQARDLRTIHAVQNSGYAAEAPRRSEVFQEKWVDDAAMRYWNSKLNLQRQAQQAAQAARQAQLRPAGAAAPPGAGAAAGPWPAGAPQLYRPPAPLAGAPPQLPAPGPSAVRLPPQSQQPQHAAQGVPQPQAAHPAWQPPPLQNGGLVQQIQPQQLQPGAQLPQQTAAP